MKENSNNLFSTTGGKPFYFSERSSTTIEEAKELRELGLDVYADLPDGNFSFLRLFELAVFLGETMNIDNPIADDTMRLSIQLHPYIHNGKLMFCFKRGEKDRCSAFKYFRLVGEYPFAACIDYIKRLKEEGVF
jgi:hypothetical protein